MSIVIDAPSFLDKVRAYFFRSRRLREYGGWKSQWRPVAGLLVALALLLLPVVGGVASVYLGQSHDLLSATIGVCVALVLVWGPTLILFREADYDQAQRLLRRHGYYARSGKRIVVPPEDVPHLNTEIAVYRSPVVKPQVADLKASLVALLRKAGIEARVSGEDVVPLRAAA